MLESVIIRSLYALWGQRYDFFCRTCPLLAAVGRNTRTFREKAWSFGKKTPSFLGKVQGDYCILLRAGGKVGFIGGNSAAQ